MVGISSQSQIQSIHRSFLRLCGCEVLFMGICRIGVWVRREEGSTKSTKLWIHIRGVRIRFYLLIMKTLVFVLLALGALAFTDQMMSLEELSKFDVSQFDCSKSKAEFLQMEHQLKLWGDILEHKKLISHDIKVLKHIEKVLTQKQNSFLQAQTNLKKSVLRLLKTLELPKLKSKVGFAQVKLLKEACKGLDSENVHDREAAKKELCRLLKEYVANLNNCKKQCSSSPITVIKIKGQIKSLEVIRGGCGQGHAVKVVDDEKTVTVDHEGKKTEVPHNEGAKGEDEE